MYNFFRYNSASRYRLIGKINGLSEVVKRTRFRLVARAKAEKPVDILAVRKQRVSEDIRHHLLAYAYMRGTPYAQLERKCRKDNQPRAQKILDIIQMNLGFKASTTLSQVEQWLAGELQ